MVGNLNKVRKKIAIERVNFFWINFLIPYYIFYLEICMVYYEVGRYLSTYIKINIPNYNFFFVLIYYKRELKRYFLEARSTVHSYCSYAV